MGRARRIRAAVRSDEDYLEVQRWIAWGLTDSQIERLTHVPRRTVGDWRRQPRVMPRRRPTGCPRCGEGALNPSAYCYLLGLYLGDGYLVHFPRDVFHLRIVLDEAYPGIIQECKNAIDSVKRIGARAAVQPRIGCVQVGSYWKHWVCLFPQHGSGPKHRRNVELQDWQKQLSLEHPGPLLRGLIHSDGWRGVNRVVVRGRAYEYPRYQFISYSAGIREIFCHACDAVGVGWRRSRWNAISVARRADVARLDRFVGPKS